MTDVSIIIPCYNQGEFLADSVGSALAQTYEAVEVIVVDDGSDDEKTRAAMAKLPPEVALLRTDNRGLPAARNHGIKGAAGQFICCLDADDMLHEDYIKETAALLQSDTAGEYAMVTTGVRNFGEEDRPGRTEPFDPLRLLLGNCIHVASLFRRSSWEEVGGYDEALAGYQDWEFWISIVERGYKWVRIDKELFFYRKRTGSMVSGSDAMRDRLIAQIVGKHRDFYTKNLTGLVVRADEICAKLMDDLREERAAGRAKLVRLARVLAQPVSSWRDVVLAPFRIAKVLVPDKAKDAIKTKLKRMER